MIETKVILEELDKEYDKFYSLLENIINVVEKHYPKVTFSKEKLIIETSEKVNNAYVIIQKRARKNAYLVYKAGFTQAQFIESTTYIEKIYMIEQINYFFEQKMEAINKIELPSDIVN